MSCSSFLHKILFGILSVHVLCDSAMTSLEGREGGGDEAQRFNGSAGAQQLVKATMCSMGM